MNDTDDLIILSRQSPLPPMVVAALRRLIDHCWEHHEADYRSTAPTVDRAGHILPAIAVAHYWLLDHEQSRGGRDQ